MDVFDWCVEGVTDVTSRNLYATNRPSYVEAMSRYAGAATAAAWATLPRAAWGNPHALIVGNLTKQNLVDLYSTYMVDSKGIPRDIYDKILVSSGEFCPFCGGLGHARTLDHYLPKAYFPAYSIVPNNLVPCCRDCNTGKLAKTAAKEIEFTIHPYLDDRIFFDERWVVAEASRIDPVLMTYTCSPPVTWSQVDKIRAWQHFESYNLAYRFTLQAGGELTRIIDSRKSSLLRLTPDEFKSYLSDNANTAAYDLNGWLRTLYKTLADTPWFCEADFHDPNWYQVG